MKNKISATGYTNVVLALNMKRFIHPDDQGRFESLRGSGDFARVLRTVWPESLRRGKVFAEVGEDKRRQGREDEMATEEIGFAAGVFRSLFLEEYNFPAYAVQREEIEFPKHLEVNFQFRKLFRRAWDNWNIYIRPTAAGLLVLRLTRRYKKPRELIHIAEDVIALQESLDVESARRWLRLKEQELRDDPAALAEIRKSVEGFLTWLGAPGAGVGELRYNPVQWKIAMEVAGRFVDAVGEIPTPDGKPALRLQAPPPRLSIPLHDSYVVHHIDELYAERGMIAPPEGRAERTAPRPGATPGASVQVPITTREIDRSPLIKRALMNLLEGAILQKADAPPTETPERYFPELRWQTIDAVLEQNRASWMDELCLITARTALLMPSRRARDDFLLVSTVPGATLRLKYARYWGAIERMIEFVIEIRTLAQLVERYSYRLLDDLSHEIQAARIKMFEGDLYMNGELRRLVEMANQQRRIAAMAQGLSDPLLWCRAEYAISKAHYLLEQIGIPPLLVHIDRNMSSLSDLVDHVDDLWATDLAEKANNLSAILAVSVAAISFILILIMLPSFWVDTQQIAPGEMLEFLVSPVLKIVGYVGTAIAFFLLCISFYVGVQALRRSRQIGQILRKAMKRLEQNP